MVFVCVGVWVVGCVGFLFSNSWMLFICLGVWFYGCCEDSVLRIALWVVGMAWLCLML